MRTPKRRRAWQDKATIFSTAMHYTTLPSPTAPTARRPLLSAVLCACIALCLFGTTPEAHAARKKTKQDTSASAKTKTKTTVKYRRSPSEETTAERDRRMYRECWGRPNAGACLGYTRR